MRETTTQLSSNDLGAPRPDRRLRMPRFDAYLLLSLGVMAWAVAVVVQHTWAADFLLHVGTVHALARDLLTPPDPMVGSGFGSPYYSPLTLIAAVLVRLTGLSPTAVFGVIALANTVLLLWAFRRFCGWFITSPLGAALALLATLFLWGIRPTAWSGFMSLRSLAEVLPYPSTLAFGLMLLAWDRLLHYRTHRDHNSLIVFGLLAATITLVHSFTAVNTAIGAAAILVAHARSWRLRDLLGFAAVGVGALLLVAAWPYSSVWEMFTAAADFAQIHRPLWDGLIDPRQLTCVFGLVAVVPLLLRLRHDRRDPLVLIFGFAAAVAALGVVTSQYHLLRVIPVAMLPLHVAFGAFLTDAAAARLALRRLVAAGAVVVVFAGLAVDVAPLSGFVNAVPTRWLPSSVQSLTRTASLTGPSHQYDFVRDFAPEGSTVLTDHRTADRHLNWLGYYTVNPGWPNPWVGDERARAEDRAALLHPGTDPATRAAIAVRYRAACVLITRTPAVTAPTAVAGYQRARVWKGGALFCR